MIIRNRTRKGPDSEASSKDLKMSISRASPSSSLKR